MYMLRFLILIAALQLSACSSVFVSQPMGENSVVLDPAAWEGTWASDEVVMLTSVLDSEAGVLQAAWLERYEEGARFETVTGTIRQTGDWYFLSMKHEPEETSEDTESASGEEPPEYLWGRIENNGRRAVLWWPDLEQFRQAVRDGRLPGQVKEDEDVLLGELDATHMETINSPSGNLMNWTEPLVFIRIGD